LEEERIKSALEIAMEKISGLPELTPEEIAEQKEKEYGPVGESVAQKYLDGRLTDNELPAELAKHSGEERLIVRKALIASLCSELRLDNDEETIRKVLQAMDHLASNKESFGHAVKDFQRIISEFDEEIEKRFLAFAALAEDALKRIGISGSAVRLNVDENESWIEESGKIRILYEPRLKEVRNRLMHSLLST
jgi:SMC interacting uncharacterized protein involved in chromosome segregation